MTFLENGAGFLGVAVIAIGKAITATSLEGAESFTIFAGILTLIGVSQFATYIKGGKNSKKEG